MTDTETTAFVLRLKPGHTAEYKKRHDELWPEMRAMLLDVGILHYEIYLHAETNMLFGHILRRRDHKMATMDQLPVAQRWRRHMADILEQRGDMPARDPLERMFLLSAAG